MMRMLGPIQLNNVFLGPEQPMRNLWVTVKAELWTMALTMNWTVYIDDIIIIR